MSNPNNQQNQQQMPTTIDAVNVMFKALEKAQKAGTYTFEESSNVYISMRILKDFVEKAYAIKPAPGPVPAEQQ